MEVPNLKFLPKNKYFKDKIGLTFLTYVKIKYTVRNEMYQSFNSFGGIRATERKS